MTRYLCLLAGIHDVPGNPRPGEQVFADSKDDALAYAAGRYALDAIPEGSTAVAIQQAAA